MFNGIIFHQGKVFKIKKKDKGIFLYLNSKINVTKKDIGVSISCDGVCLTLVSIKKKLLCFYLSNETLKRSKFKKIKIDDKINLELPIRFGQKISGHFCQGHVDDVATISQISKYGKSIIYTFKVNKSILSQLVDKASILINGVSLTISKKIKNGFQIWVIPHTLKLTNLSNANKGDLVNIEIDILSKYVKKYFNEK